MTATDSTAGEHAPGALELVRLFVNTHDPEDGTEKLGTPAAMRAWLRAHDLPDVQGAKSADLRRLVGVREAVRRLLLANNGQPQDERALARLRTEAARVPLRVHFDNEGGSVLEPAANGMDAVIARLLAIVHESMAAGTWPRLKACRSDTCEWAFYDHSRNRSGTWCSMATCGNRAKARSFRRRHGST